ncbi:MAG: hypothetical protein WD248_03655 [Actinomycetota bacterium]
MRNEAPQEPGDEVATLPRIEDIHDDHAPAARRRLLARSQDHSNAATRTPEDRRPPASPPPPWDRREQG